MELTADSYSVKRAGAKAPISAHPAFPAIVALWFAALLGLGSLVLPIALLERLVTATGIAAVVPAASPPLGFTAHAGVALVGAIGGALLGLMLARKVASAHAPEPAARQYAFDDELPCRPISAHDELGEEGLDSAPVAHKRRSLALAETNLRSTYLEAAPLPGMPREPQADLASPGDEAPIPSEPVEELATQPLELAEFADFAEGEGDEAQSESNAALDALRSRIHTPVEPDSLQDQPMTESPSDARRDIDSLEVSEETVARDPGADAVDPLPFAPPSLRRAEPAFDEEGEDSETEGHFAKASEDRSPYPAIINSAAEPEADDDRPLEELGLVQLATRLGASLEKRKARLAVAPAAEPMPVQPFATTEDFEAAGADDAARAIADFFGPTNLLEPVGGEAEPALHAVAPAMPAALRLYPLPEEDEADEDSLSASFSLPLKPVGVPVATDHGPLGDGDDENDDEGNYSSLLAMKNPFAREEEFVRVEEPDANRDALEPTVSFPSRAPAEPFASLAEEPAVSSPRPFDPPKSAGKPQVAPAPRDPADAERNLRAALATLQRMSGAA